MGAANSTDENRKMAHQAFMDRDQLEADFMYLLKYVEEPITEDQVMAAVTSLSPSVQNVAMQAQKHLVNFCSEIKLNMKAYQDWFKQNTIAKRLSQASSTDPNGFIAEDDLQSWDSIHEKCRHRINGSLMGELDAVVKILFETITDNTGDVIRTTDLIELVARVKLREKLQALRALSTDEPTQEMKKPQMLPSP
jgi:hypothetical protein